MTYEQKMAAMKGLGIHPAVHMRSPGDWYVSMSGVEIGDGAMLSGAGGSGRTPQEAIEATWERISELREPQRLIINAMRDDRKEVRWNGFMWESLEVAVVAANR